MNIIKAYKSCAACKYQRRKCSKDCPLAPYFPGDKPKMFANAYRLFGVSNLLTILKEVKDEDKDKAMKSIIFESDIRARFRTHGCLGVIKMYESALKECIKELDDVERLLDYCKLNCNSEPSTSSQIPIFNNIGDAPNYYHNNISDIIPPSDGDYAMEDHPNLLVTKGLSNNEELVLDRGVDAQIITNFDLVKEKIFSDYSGGDYAMEDNTTLMGTKGLSHNEELVHDQGVDTKIYATLGEEGIFSDNYNIDDLISFG
ncbi:hypothetical protein TSUD_274740 [Trifolium subterraneum]|uniref:LOB domain-containing protein n=1 Tax=Trifolium subterraneum TaxID=3900 RepID=A0A2Z6NF36_TRISU|nr:hypothetical protein TSUD_274740 [Trifolium subterraneum]